MGESVPLTDFGQIKAGDTITYDHSNGKKSTRKVREVLNAGTKQEEVIVNLSRNHYFITSMALDGSSWVKNVRVLKRNTPEKAEG